MQTLIVAIGNSLRRDDGAGHRVVELLGPVAGADTRSVMQLTPELADEIAPYGRVVFVDADIEPGDPRLEVLVEEEATRNLLGHALSPGGVVALARRLFGFQGEALLCRVPGSDFAEGERLSPGAETNSEQAAEILRGLLA